MPGGTSEMGRSWRWVSSMAALATRGEPCRMRHPYPLRRLEARCTRETGPMSKAFTKESDGDDDDDRDGADDGAIPGGFTNYITPAGHKRLNDELSRLWKVDRRKLVDVIAWAA